MGEESAERLKLTCPVLETIVTEFGYRYEVPVWEVEIIRKEVRDRNPDQSHEASVKRAEALLGRAFRKPEKTSEELRDTARFYLAIRAKSVHELEKVLHDILKIEGNTDLTNSKWFEKTAKQKVQQN